MAEMWLTNPLEDVFRTTKKPFRCPYDRRPDYKVEMACNSRESIQLAINVAEDPIIEATARVEIENAPENCGISFDCGGVRYIDNSGNSINIFDEMKRSDLPGELPQCIDRRPIKIIYRQTGAFFITVNTSKDAVAGDYDCKIIVDYTDGKNFKRMAHEYPFKLKVHPVVLPDGGVSEYNYAQWLDCCGYHPEAVAKPTVECNENVYGIKNFSEEWFTLLKNYARQMKKERMNILYVPIYYLLYEGIKYGENGEYIFDFTLFDRFIDTFLEHADIKYFCGFHLILRTSKVPESFSEDWRVHLNAPLVSWIFKEGRGLYNFAWEYLEDDAAWKHLEMLIKGIYEHLKERGLEKKWIQHVSDEVDTAEQFAQIRKVYRKIHEWAPDFKTIDATRDTSLEGYGSDLDIHVPQIDVYDYNEEKYTAAQEAGDIEVWTYTCLKPQFGYMSRLDDWKLIATRLIHWFNYLHDAKGYLHWSWNLWFYCNEPNQPFMNGCCNGWPLDGWVVLPDVENLDVFETIRQRASISGIEDFELLNICDKIDREKTRMLAGILVERANDFTLDTNLFFRVRSLLLDMASGK